MGCSLFQLLNNLFLVLETDTSNVELARIARFMQEVGMTRRSVQVASSYPYLG